MPVQFVEFGTVGACRNPCCWEYRIAAEVSVAHFELEQGGTSANFTLSEEHSSQISQLYSGL